MSKKSTTKQPVAPTRSNAALIVGAAVVLVVVIVGAVLLSQRTANSTQGAVAQALRPEVTVNEAASLRDQGAFVLDVREPTEWNDYHVPGSTLIPLGELASRVQEVPKDKPVVVVCRSGNRSQTGRDVLLKAGFTQVTSLAGGLKGWQAAGQPTVTGP